MDDALGLVLLLAVAAGMWAVAIISLALAMLLGAVVGAIWLGACLVAFLRWLWYHLSFAGDEAGTSAGL